jgi:RNA polymerase sigma factor (sigma-70 family)
MEKEVIIQFTNGSPEAFTKIYRFYVQRTLQFARARFRDEEKAQDFVQELFSRIWERREKFRNAENFDLYLWGVTWKLSITHLRKKLNHQNLGDEAIPEPNHPVDNHLDDLSIENDINNIVEFALASTTQQRRLIYKI